jgi:hypothetical protein
VIHLFDIFIFIILQLAEASDEEKEQSLLSLGQLVIFGVVSATSVCPTILQHWNECPELVKQIWSDVRHLNSSIDIGIICFLYICLLHMFVPFSFVVVLFVFILTNFLSQ